MLIVECDIADGIVPTVLCAAAAGRRSRTCGKVILAVGSSEGAVTLFDVNQVFRLGRARESSSHWDTAVVSWEDFYCGRPVLGLPDTSTDLPRSHFALFHLVAVCTRRTSLSCVVITAGKTRTSLVLANLAADTSRTRWLAHKLPFQTQHELGHLSYCDLCHVHMPPESMMLIGARGPYLLWVITNHVALVLQPSLVA